MPSLVTPYAAALRRIAERMALPAVPALALQPGVTAIYRVTVYYVDQRAYHTVATVEQSPVKGAVLELRYEGAFGSKALRYTLIPTRYEAFVTDIRSVGFDRLPDAPQLTSKEGVIDVWMIERAAGSFYHSVILAPALALGVYATLVAATRAHLPEAVREIPR